ncbi:uncharacterized protein TNCV_1098711 [Trichonephila clavipes]|nr:uncharacterized protein TNCV_1098711 [Trichonephila clavipes]
MASFRGETIARQNERDARGSDSGLQARSHVFGQRGVSDIVLNPPKSDKYHTLSQRLITQFSDSETQKIKKLLTDLQLGDEKPSHLLRKMKELSNGQLQDDFLQSLCLQRMPPHIQTVLSASSESLDKLAIIADKVSEVVGAS